MAKSFGPLRALLWIGVIINLLWFLLFCFGTPKILANLSFSETPNYMLRLYGVFPLSWAILFLFALRDVEKNMAIVKAGIITGFLTAISIVAYSFVFKPTGSFHWASTIILVVYSLLLLFFKPALKKT
jgi:hypothetical protein